MLSIGEFSRVTQLTIKALRLYHDKGILIPDKIDYDSKYRYYRSSAVEKALAIKRLKDLGFSLEEIKKIIVDCSDDGQLVGFVEEKLSEVNQAIRQYQEIKETLSGFLKSTNGAFEDDTHPQSIDFQVQWEAIPDVLVGGIRFRGRYSEIGARIGDLFKKCGRLARGKPFTLYYDGDYKEENADLEVCVEIKNKVKAEGIDCRLLQGGQALTLLHKGPYEELGRSYQVLFEYCRENHIDFQLPLREKYLKSPGFVFRGNPKKYLTQLMAVLGNNQAGRSSPV